MPLSKVVLSNIAKRISEATKLSQKDSRQDPPTNPYASKYAAREILLEMLPIVKDLQQMCQEDTKSSYRTKGIEAFILIECSVISGDVEEFSTAREYLDKCVELLRDCLEHPFIVGLALSMYNQLGFVYSIKAPNKSLEYLNEARELYTKYKSLQNESPLDPLDLFKLDEPINSDLAWQHIEQTYTLTLYFLAQVYKAKEDQAMSSLYCHMTLERQLESADFEPDIEWALNAATLSQFFLEGSDFPHARHHLAASSNMLDKLSAELTKTLNKDELFDEKMEIFNHRSADIARCWAKYGILLLEKSRDRLLEEDSAPSLSKKNDSVDTFKFKNLADLSHYESEITCDFVLTAPEARDVFQNTQKWLDKAENYYSLENHASDFIDITQDRCTLYLNLLFFEESPEVQAKLQKRRVDLLENLLKNLNPHYYLSSCRLLTYTLASTYLSLLDIKSDSMKESEARPTPHSLTKINTLVDKSIGNYQKYIQLLKIKDGEKVEADSEISYLKAVFHMGALNGKYITLDPKLQIERTKASLVCYKKVVDYKQTNEKIKEAIPMELKICEEMVTLLPVKLADLQMKLECDSDDD